jgi:hypothetical protein
MAGKDRPARPGVGRELPAGVLTAGSFDDNRSPQNFLAFASRSSQNPFLSEVAGLLRGDRLEVVVRNGQGQPVGNAKVRVTSTSSAPAVELTTRSDGRVVVVESWDLPGAGGDLRVSVTPPDGSGPVSQTVPKGSRACAITLATAPAPLPRNLDLVFVLDTTGSMGDELGYLKAEVRSISEAVRQRFPQVEQRYALVCYRDENSGDEYVTRKFDFTPDLDAFRDHVAAQSAAGGGDLPEAMQRGLEQAVTLQWRDADTARVLFLVADAPPHAPDVKYTLRLVDKLRRQGVAVYPVAASCGDRQATEALEFVFRSAALLTGSQYLFLTDDSGVGDAHGEPQIPQYQVEKLNRLMLRMIADEVSGKRTEPEAGDVLRNVGHAQ